MTMRDVRDERLLKRLIDAAEAIESELSQEGARSLRDEERGQVEALSEELETLALAVVYDEELT